MNLCLQFGILFASELFIVNFAHKEGNHVSIGDADYYHE